MGNLEKNHWKKTQEKTKEKNTGKKEKNTGKKNIEIKQKQEKQQKIIKKICT